MLLLPTFVERSMHLVGLGASSTHVYLASEHGAGGKRLWVRIPSLHLNNAFTSYRSEKIMKTSFIICTPARGFSPGRPASYDG